MTSIPRLLRRVVSLKPGVQAGILGAGLALSMTTAWSTTANAEVPVADTGDGVVSNGAYDDDRPLDASTVAASLKGGLMSIARFDVTGMDSNRAAKAIREMAKRTLAESGRLSSMSFRVAVVRERAYSDGVGQATVEIKATYPNVTEDEVASDTASLVSLVSTDALLFLGGAPDLPAVESQEIVRSTLRGMGETVTTSERGNVVDQATDAAALKLDALKSVARRVDDMRGEADASKESSLARQYVWDVVSSARKDVSGPDAIARDALLASAIERHHVRTDEFDRAVVAAMTLDVSNESLTRISRGLALGADLAAVAGVARSALASVEDQTNALRERTASTTAFRTP